MEKCPYAFRKQGKAGVFCKLVKDPMNDYCGHQYLCPNTKRWEATPMVSKCALRRGAKGKAL